MLNVSDKASRRKSGRLGQEGLTCQLGPVINLSGGGMRVICRKPPKDRELHINLRGILGEALQAPIRARVAWTRKLSMFKYEVGFQFMDLDDETSRKLTEVSTMHRNRRITGT